jgi:hypothetical protein
MIRFFVAAAAAAWLAVGTAAAAEPPKGKVTLEQGAGAKQGPVTFDHAGTTHKAQKCETCHAKAEGGKITPALDQKSGHATCQKCHMETAKADPAKKSLQACTNCHAKKA